MLATATSVFPWTRSRSQLFAIKQHNMQVHVEQLMLSLRKHLDLPTDAKWGVGQASLLSGRRGQPMARCLLSYFPRRSSTSVTASQGLPAFQI